LRNATNEVNGQEDRQRQKEREANKGKQNRQNRHDAETNMVLYCGILTQLTV